MTSKGEKHTVFLALYSLDPARLIKQSSDFNRIHLVPHRCEHRYFVLRIPRPVDMSGDGVMQGSK